MASSSRYRIESRRIIAATASAHVGDEASLWRAVSAAYPFGERRYHPYKIWLDEVAKTKLARTPRVSVDDAAVVLVAHDLVQLGRVDEAEALLAAQAPGRLTRKCPTCGAWPGRRCREVTASVTIGRKTLNNYTPLAVPHAARVEVSDGPLFGENP